MPLEWGLLTFAAASTRAGVYSRSSVTNRVSTSDPYLQSLVIPFLDEREFRGQGCDRQAATAGSCRTRACHSNEAHRKESNASILRGTA